MSFQVRDALLTVTRALPNGAAAVTSTALDTETVASGRQLADFELLIEAPAMNTTQMPNAKTMTYAIVTSTAENLSNPVVIADAVLVQTGAAGAGCAAATARFRLPTNAARYIGVRATGSASGDATTASAVASFVF
jgi:hypothetical protein